MHETHGPRRNPLPQTLPRLSLLLAGACLLAAAWLLLPGDDALAEEQATGPARCPAMQGQATADGAWCPKGPLAALHLSEQQLKEIQDIRAAYRQESDRLKTAIQEKRESLDRLFRDPEASEPQILEVQRSLVELKTETMNTTLSARLKARGVLTPEQVRQLPGRCWLGIGDGGCGCPGHGKGCSVADGSGKCPHMRGHHGSGGGSPSGGQTL